MSKAKFCPERVKDPKRFDPKSFRTKKFKAHRITFGCPKSAFDSKRKRCRRPVEVQRILHPAGEKKCPVPGVEVGKRRNPGAKWHEVERDKYFEIRSKLPKSKPYTWTGGFLTGKIGAHSDSADKSMQLGINPRSKRWRGILSGKVKYITPKEMKMLKSIR